MEASNRLKVERTKNVLVMLIRTKARYGRRGLPWEFPPGVLANWRRIEPMARRYKKGDYRHTLDEALAEEDFALWLVNQHQAMERMPLKSEAPWQSPWLDGKRRSKRIAA